MINYGTLRTTVEEIPGTRGYLELQIEEHEDHIDVEACIYDGYPESLKTPENCVRFPTTAKARAWGVDYAMQFLPDSDHVSR